MNCITSFIGSPLKKWQHVIFLVLLLWFSNKHNPKLKKLHNDMERELPILQYSGGKIP